MDRYVPSRRDDRPPVYHFGAHPSQGQGQSSRGDNYRPPPPSNFSFRAQNDRPPPRFPTQPLAPVHSTHAQRRKAERLNGARRPNREPNQQKQQLAQQQRQERLRQNHQQAQNKSAPPRQPRNQQFRGRGRGGFRHQRPATAARPLLSGQRETTPDQLDGMIDGEARFNALEDLSDSVEEDMDIESNDSGDERPAKKIHIDIKEHDDGEEAPKWSNPDPYYVLPPTEETGGKKKDVIRVIRKAKVSSTKSKATLANNSDFISFDDFNEESMQESSEESDLSLDRIGVNLNSIAALPTKPSSDWHSRSDRSPPTTTQRSGVWPPLPDEVPPPPPPPLVKDTMEIDVWPPPPPGPPPTESRKRDSNTVSGSTSVPQNTGAKRKRGDEGGISRQRLVPEWRARPNIDSTPWYKVDLSGTEHMGTRLHKEICHFYDHVRPLEFENSIRMELVRRVQSFLNKEYPDWDAQVDYFGSFAAGIYLPDADMDLVVRSGDFLSGGYPEMGQTKKFLFKFASALEKRRAAKSGSSQAIVGAKVPIIKYIDDLTGLKVDVCFENDTGVMAIDTYSQWRSQHPAMSVIVTLVKHFLLMRGLNDVSVGGLGGFSVTCLVVSLMQHMPQLQSKNMLSMQNLGEVLMEFFDFYGNRFNSTITGIEFNPPRYFQKHLNRDIKQNPKRPWSLAIIDPNRPDNNISGGTSNILAIFKSFSEAFTLLQTRMSDLREGINSAEDNGSILGVICAGDYYSFDSQRDRLRELYAAG